MEPGHNPGLELLKRANQAQAIVDNCFGRAPDDPDFHIRDLDQEERERTLQAQRLTAADDIISRALGEPQTESSPQSPNLPDRKKSKIIHGIAFAIDVLDGAIGRIKPNQSADRFEPLPDVPDVVRTWHD